MERVGSPLPAQGPPLEASSPAPPDVSGQAPRASGRLDLHRSPWKGLPRKRKRVMTLITATGPAPQGLPKPGSEQLYFSEAPWGAEN